jgi:uncharacterized membrane protein YfcA
MGMELDIALLLFGTGLLAGMIDAIAGGGGLITLPVLLFIGLGPTEALATNKLQGSFGTFSASFYFVRRGLVKLSEIRFLIFCTFIGSAAGTLLVQYTDPGLLARVIPLLLIATALYFLFAPPFTEETRRQRISYPLFALSIGFSVGFYDGFFGPGAGTFFAVGGVLLMGFNLIQTTAHTKVLNFTSNLASLILFALAGHVVWKLGLVMAAGQLIGARIGARMVVKNGARLIRPLIVVVTVLISFKLLLE